jgi:hypothetical protein
MKPPPHRNLKLKTDSPNSQVSTRLGLILLGILLIFFGVITSVQGEVVYSEDFNTEASGDWPDNWIVENGVWEHGIPTTGPANCAGGDDSATNDFCVGTVLDDNYPLYTDSRLIGPNITLPTVTGDVEVHLRFWHWFAFADSADTGQVQISVWDDSTGWSGWNNLGGIVTGSSNSEWKLKGDDNDMVLTIHAGKKVRFGFVHTDNYSYRTLGWYIDDIEVFTDKPVCTPRILDPIGNKTIEPGDLLTFTVTAHDPDGGELTLTVTNLPAGAEFIDNGDGAGLFSWQTTEEAIGSYSPVTFKATKSCGSSAFEDITITVGDVNQPPVLEPIGDHSLEAGELFTLDLSASDPDEDELTFTATDLPPGAIFTDNGDGDDTAQFSWTPDEDLAGNYFVTFIVTDNGSPALSDSEEVTLTVGDVNRPPVLDPIGNQVIGSGEELALLLTATDPDEGDLLTYEASGIPTGATFIDNGNGTAEFTWTPDEEITGNFWMTFKVTDDGVPAESDSESLHISVGHMNRTPVMGPVGNHGITPGEPFHYALHASDPEGDALCFNVAGLPEDAGFVDNDDGSAEFSWNPTEDDIQNHHLLFRVIDTAEPIASDWEEVTFTVGEINRPPMLAPIGNRTVALEEEISLTLTSRDPDGDKPSYEASNLPEGADWVDNEDGTALFTWTPTLDQAGTYTMTFTVTDNVDEGEGESESDSETIVISVGGVNRPPLLNPIGDMEVDEGTAVWIPVIAGDPDGHLIDLSVLDIPEDAAFTDYGNGTGEFYWLAELEADEAEGDETNLVTFVATDLGLPTETASEEVSITVRGVCELPQAPEDLSAKATRKRVTLTWEYESEGDVDQFNIYRSVDKEPFELYATSTETSYTDRNLPNDFDQIEYYVKAVNACGESDPSNTVTLKHKGP